MLCKSHKPVLKHTRKKEKVQTIGVHDWTIDHENLDTLELIQFFLKRVVEESQEYQEFVAERQQSQAQPPEMPLITAARIAACLSAEQPELAPKKTRRRAGRAIMPGTGRRGRVRQQPRWCAKRTAQQQASCFLMDCPEMIISS